MSRSVSHNCVCLLESLGKWQKLTSVAYHCMERVHEQEAREGAQDASLERLDLAEERVRLYADDV